MVIQTIADLVTPKCRRAVLRKIRQEEMRFIFILLLFVIAATDVNAATLPVPSFQIGVEEAKDAEDLALTLEIIALITILSLAPAILVLMTSFTRFIIVFHFLRQAMGIQGSPPNQVIVGLSLFLTFFVMKPVWQDVYQNALQPYMEDKLSHSEAFDVAQNPMRKFMLLNTREKDLALFVRLAKEKRPKNKQDVSMLTLIPAFIISELQTAFIIGFMIYIPFIVIDMVVSSVLLSMGMMMLPPIMISLPFKLMLFVLVDGWNIIVGSMVKSFGVY